jgi:hypothetical protein
MRANAYGGPWSPIHNRKDNPMNILPEKIPGTVEWCGIEEAAGLLALRAAE